VLASGAQPNFLHFFNPGEIKSATVFMSIIVVHALCLDQLNSCTGTHFAWNGNSAVQVHAIPIPIPIPILMVFYLLPILLPIIYVKDICIILY
jgi:hypothetical protein